MPVQLMEPTAQPAETPAAVAVTAAADESAADASAAGPPSSGGEPGYDIGRARKREHGESRSL
jgi:hypothetical protein